MPSWLRARATIDMGTGAPVGDQFSSPDNLAIDADGNIYIVEDQPGGIEDIWFMQDRDDDGVAEAIGKWASLTTAGAESTGLYFNPFRPNQAFINVQHPDSGVDRTMMFEIDKDSYRYWDWDKQGHDHHDH